MLMYQTGLICALFGWASSMGADTLKTVRLLKSGFLEDLVNFTNFDFLRNGLGRVLSDDIAQLNKSKQNIDTQCWNQFYEIMVSSQNGDLLALKFLDSWGKIPSGIMWGHLVELGNFDECLSINNQLNQNADVIQGQYCMANLPLEIFLNISSQLTQGANLKVGICIPRSCNALSANTIINQIISRILNVPTITYDIITQDKCIKSSNKSLETIDWIAIIIFSFTAIIILYSTIYDWVTKRRGSIPRQELVAFSLFVNFRLLFQTSSRKSPNIVSCLNGIRCLSIIWIVFGHSYMMSLLLPNINTIEILEWAQTPFSMFLQSGTISVDSFFFLSGFLLVWAGLKEMEKNKGTLNVPLMYIHRYIRLTPVVAVTMLFFVSFYRHMGNGPLWNGFTSSYTLCYETWWATLLYVQNFAAAGKMCVGHTWYLAVDMQLYIISPLILIPLYKWKKKLIAVVIIFGLLLVACIFTTIVINNFSVFNTTGNLGADTTEMRKIYYSTHARASPWLIGIIFGYFIYQKRNSRTTMSKKVVIGGWILSLALLATGIFALYPKTLPGAKPLTVVEGAFYLSLSRVAWPLALSWIVFACVNGYGGFANTILSLTFWQPMARLSYCMYITHLLVETINSGRTKVNVHFSNYDVILRFWGDFGITILVSIVTFIMFESPMIGIEKALFGPKKTKPATKTGISNQTFYQNES